MSQEPNKMSEEAIKECFGENLKFARMRLGLSQTELAARADVQRMVVGNVEKGDHNATFKVLVRLCLAVGYHPTDLFNPGFLQFAPRAVAAENAASMDGSK
ncbi:helix-turn-helix transcriptional regulator [Herbaspirillum sp. LeCh32-8]|uniref:helix-turn-helix transcriptional regulator n=1 Tax=Herbaspirillum sp. LeCh32-8 TaxID=2821356 RepID=UPI001AE5B9A9|nr:helix-turn-helix transcriptional regulator [Herbaspirillum sp. LeCh32-8]MBP0598877.1 helix-turn-helix transcriptional regulator [Herbaspirillum sp. LeCh32-8]